MKKKIMIIIFVCTIILGIIAFVHFVNIPKVLTEEEAIEVLKEYIFLDFTQYEILGSDFNQTVDINGEEYYKFSIMGTSETDEAVTHILERFIVAKDGSKVYRYDVINNCYIKLQKIVTIY